MIHQKLGRTCDVASLLASALMKHAISPNRFGAGIGKNWERITLAFTKLPRFFTGIDTDRDHLRIARGKFWQTPLKTP